MYNWITQQIPFYQSTGSDTVRPLHNTFSKAWTFSSSTFLPQFHFSALEIGRYFSLLQAVAQREIPVFLKVFL